MARLGWATLRHYWIGNGDNNDVYRARSPDLRLCSFYAAKHSMVADLWHLGHPKSMVTETKTRTNRCLVLNNIIIEAKDRILAYTTQL